MNRKRSMTVWVVLAAVGLIAALLAFGQLNAVARAQEATPTPEPAPGATRVRETDGAVMVYVPAGEFLMGSSVLDGTTPGAWPQHAVYLDGYWIDRTEVTNRQFEVFVKATGYRTDAEKEGTGGVFAGFYDFWFYDIPAVKGADWRHPEGPDSIIAERMDGPVLQASWNDGRAYCQWAAARFPTEAEWEKAACGTDGRRYPWGDQVPSCQYAVMADDRGKSCGQGDKPLSVGSKPEGASPYGALDMAGNVWEWVADWYAINYYAHSPASNPQGPDSGNEVSSRGGAWTDGAQAESFSRCTFRGSDPPNKRSNADGFRCAASASASASAAPTASPPATPSPAAPPRYIELDAVWGISGSDVFAIGKAGTILHYNGSAWSVMSSGTTLALSDLWGSSGSDVFAVGEAGAILHYDGSAWSAMKSGTYNDLIGVWGGSGSNVFAVGGNGAVLHYNGSVWSAMSSGTTQFLFTVWGSSDRDVFAVGLNGTVLHYDGSIWSAMTSGTTADLVAVWGSSGSDVFAVGGPGTILHYDGSAWSAMNSGATHEVWRVWGSSGRDVFAVGLDGTILHYDGSAWSVMNSGVSDPLWGVWGSSDRDVFVVGGAGTILHYDGSVWSRMTQQ